MVFVLSYKNLLDFITFELNSILNISLDYTPFTKQVLTSLFLNLASSLYGLVAVILDTGFHRSFKPVCVKDQDNEK